VTLYGRANTRLRYLFDDLRQARTHVRDVQGRSLFFCPDEKLRFLPDAPVCLSFEFAGGEVTRLLHGQVASAVEGSGTWIEIFDTRPLVELTPTEAIRRSVRLGCDAPVEIRSEKRTATVRMLDLSMGGARFSGAEGFAEGDHLELRLLAADGLTFHDLAFANVVWAHGQEMGVQFDRSDVVGRHAVARLIAETEELWAKAWQGEHAEECCAGNGVLEPEPPVPARIQAPGSVVGT
jgi:hypothetical protein